MNIYPNNFNPYLTNQQPWQPQPQIQPQQYQVPQMIQSIPCRYAQNFESITANEIPMDGNYAVFLKSDLSEIQLKKWNGNGGIENISFKPSVQEVLEDKHVDNFQMLNDRMNALESAMSVRFDKLEASFAPKQTARKKEVSDE